MGSSQHQLDPVQLVYLAGSGIIVHGNDVGFRMLAAQLLDDALSNDMVGQAAPKGWTQTMFLVPPLMSSNISPVRNQPSPGRFPRETKPLAMDARYLIFVGGVKWTLFSRAIRADLRKYSRREIAVLQSQAVECFAPRCPAFEIAVVEAVQQKVHEIRHHGLFPAPSDSRSSTMWLLAVGENFTEDLAHDPHLGFLDVQPLQAVEIADDAADVLCEVHHAQGGAGKLAYTDLFPFFMQGVGRAGHL